MPTRRGARRRAYRRGAVRLYHGDALELGRRWPSPVAIVVDGPYGLGSFPGDPPTPAGLADWYRPHVALWAERATPETTLWFWNSELGWATVHPVLEAHGWRYRSCHVWDKGTGHVAGNANSKTLRKFPVVTEVCVQYVRDAEFRVGERTLSMQAWLRHEWERTGLPFYRANEACGVANAATRKYLTACHLWYYPPVEAFQRLAAYANEHGAPEGRPYFSVDGRRPIPGRTWERMRAKFRCEIGV
ncbi:MAG: DNA methyltransferase, partial [Planctomycetota bacterium]